MGIAGLLPLLKGGGSLDAYACFGGFAVVVVVAAATAAAARPSAVRTHRC